MEHQHMHLHSADSSKNILSAFLLNITFTIISLVGGWLTNSMAIISDSIHDLGCSFSLGLAWVFERISHRKPSNKFTFGYRRFTLLGAFVNAFILLIGSSIVMYESITRLINPQDVSANGMFWLAIVAIVFKGVAVISTWKGKNVNERMVSLHLLGDCLGWVAVLVASIVMMFVEVPHLDSILSICISIYILYNVVHNLIIAFRIVLEGAPSNMDVEKVRQSISDVEGVDQLDVFRVWSIDNIQHAAELSVQTHLNSLNDIEIMKNTIRTMLAQQQVTTVTIEVTPLTK